MRRGRKEWSRGERGGGGEERSEGKERRGERGREVREWERRKE